MVLSLKSVHLNVGYRKEQSLAPSYFLFILMTYQTAKHRASLGCMLMTVTYAGVDVNSIQLNLNHDLDNLNKWLSSNKLTLNR